MKKLSTILGVFFFASIVFTSCGGAESDGAALAQCFCDAKEDTDKMSECMKMSEEHQKAYEGDENAEKEYQKGMNSVDCAE